MSEDAQLQALLEKLDQLERDNERLRSRASTESQSRMMAEEALGETEDRLQLALDAAGLAMWEWDIVQGMVFTTARFEELVDGVPPNEAADREWLLQDLSAKVHPADLPALALASLRLFKQQDLTLEVEFRLAAAEGEVWMECTGRVIQRDMLGRAERMVGILRDVTRRREAQRDIEAARATAVSANAAKDEFLANISHEIRTPLNGVLGMNQLLAQTDLSNEQRKYVDLVASSGRNLLSLVNEVLDYSRLQAQGVVLEHIRFDLRRWLWALAEPQRLAAQAKELDLRLELDADLPADAVGDPGRLGQIVNNLLSNAIKFTHVGQIDLRMGLTSMDEASQAKGFMLRIEVRDTGIGIAQHKQHSIFDAFVQADSSTSRHYGGSGLGLSICAKLALLMGGTITLDSLPEQGSCFVVCIPLEHAAGDSPVSQLPLGDTSHFELPATSVTAEWPRYAGKVALVVDDHHVNQLLAAKYLERLGFEVELAEDGVQALEKLDALQSTSKVVDVVLMDIQMPRMNGRQAAQAIRKAESLHSKPRRPILALSANASSADSALAIAAGMDGYLSKPLTFEALAGALQSALMPSALPVVATAATLRANFVAAPAPNASQAAFASAITPNHTPTSIHTIPGSTTALTSAATLASIATTELSRATLLARMGGDNAAVQEMAQAFCTDLRERMGLAFEALKQSNWPQLRSQSHALKGALLTMTAGQAAQDAQALEAAASAQDSAAAAHAFKSLAASSKAVFEVIMRW